MNKPLILVVEDDPSVRNLITTTLKTNDYRYVVAPNGSTAITEATSHNPEIILLDLGLPDMDGVQVIQTVRSWSNVPIIVISARSEDNDKIKALDAGADDYLTKPFSVEELLARLRVTQRRLAMMTAEMATASSVFVNGKLKVDYAGGCAYLGEDELHLTPIEYKLLCLLSKNVGKVLTHTFITQNIWGRSWDNDVASLRVFMATLRKKLEPTEESPQYIQTHIGVGYRMIKVNEQDFSKHAPNEIVPKIRMLWNSIPSQLARENKKFVYGLVREGARAKDYETAILWLSDCGLVHKISRVNAGGIPLKAYEDLKAFKLFLVDVGLLGCMAGLRQRTLLDGNDLFIEFKGALTEQYVCQQLKTIEDLGVYYYTNDRGSCEIDFIVDTGEQVIPVEVKAETNLRAKSLKTYQEKFTPEIAVRTSMADFKKEDRLVNLPLYAVEQIAEP